MEWKLWTLAYSSLSWNPSFSFSRSDVRGRGLGNLGQKLCWQHPRAPPYCSLLQTLLQILRKSDPKIHMKMQRLEIVKCLSNFWEQVQSWRVYATQHQNKLQSSGNQGNEYWYTKCLVINIRWSPNLNVTFNICSSYQTTLLHGQLLNVCVCTKAWVFMFWITTMLW